MYKLSEDNRLKFQDWISALLIASPHCVRGHFFSLVFSVVQLVYYI
jgi:hypothetical protein